MNIFILITLLILLTVQVFFFCNCQINLVSFNGVPNFNLSSSTLKILKSADFINFKTIQTMIEFGSSSYSRITANIPSVNAAELAKTVITNSVQNDLTKMMNALNAVATSLAGCIPQKSYPNDLNISTSCFTSSCSSTGIQCQALYLQIAIDELTIAVNTAASTLNVTTSSLVGSNWNFPSLSALTTQWLIVQGSAAAYQSSTKTGPLISTVNSSFKRVLGAALNGTNLFLNSFESGYKALISAVNNTNYVQTLEDNANLNILSATSSAEKRLLIDTFMVGGIIVTASPVQSTISGISITSFVRPSTILVFDNLAALSSTFNSEFSTFQGNIQSLNAAQQTNMANLKLNSTQLLKSKMYEYEGKATTEDINKCCAPLSVTANNPFPDAVWKTDLSPVVQSVQTSVTNLKANYTNLISSYTNMAINCFKVGCTGNTIYPYSLWKLQCVNDFSFTSFCWSSGFPRTLQRCPSAKAQALNACLDDVISLISSLQPSNDMNMVLDDARSSFDALLEDYSVTVNAIYGGLKDKSLCIYTRLYSTANSNPSSNFTFSFF